MTIAVRALARRIDLPVPKADPAAGRHGRHSVTVRPAAAVTLCSIAQRFWTASAILDVTSHGEQVMRPLHRSSSPTRTAAVFLMAAGLMASTASAQSASNPAPEPTRVAANTTRAVAGHLHRAASRELAHVTLSKASARFSLVHAQQPAQSRGWIGRHPVVFGTLVGFGGGFLIGYLPGDDAVINDGAAGFNGLVMGAVGTGIGAAIGVFVGAAR